MILTGLQSGYAPPGLIDRSAHSFTRDDRLAVPAPRVHP